MNQISESSFVFNLHRVTNSFYSFIGDDVRWYPSKEGGHANELLSIRAICGSQNIEDFFSSKWPDLGTKRFKEGGDGTTMPRAHIWTSSLSIACKPMRAELVQFHLVALRLARFQIQELEQAQI